MAEARSSGVAGAPERARFVIGGQLAHYGEGRQPRTDVDRGVEVLDAAMSHGTTLHGTLTQAAARAARDLAQACARLAILPEPEPAEGGSPAG
ncbi:hypothetical protein [Actinophytocola sp.]|uniref:hypothetical protein n=1 Tax=Actinophytocola sp. TaxID=1872138 RepID=UPI002ED45543